MIEHVKLHILPLAFKTKPVAYLRLKPLYLLQDVYSHVCNNPAIGFQWTAQNQNGIEIKLKKTHIVISTPYNCIID